MSEFNFVRAIASATLAGVLLIPTGTMGEEKSLGEQLVGAWIFVSSNGKLPDGSPLWGTNPKGLMIFTADGHYSWQVFRSDRPKIVSKNRMNGTAEENAAILQGSLAYFGTYSVDQATKTITTVVEGSTFPNSEGETLKRVVTSITADTLVYENPATTRGEQVEAVWKRIK
jgi:Lipocalin-like domain